MNVRLELAATGLLAISGLPGLLLRRRGGAGQRVATMLIVVGSCVGLIGLTSSGSANFSLAWSLPDSRFAVGIDALSALFLIPVLLISALGSIYGLEYWPQHRHPTNGNKLRVCWGLLSGAMMLVVMARDAMVFLIAWEVMALATFFLVTTEERKTEVRRAGWIYLIATHAGTLLLFALFALLRHANGSFDLWPIAQTQVSNGLMIAIFLSGVIGFGFKAGLMPLHVWLPGAHANAPSHVSAILSGVLLKMGVYGILRVVGVVPHPPVWWAATLLLAGSISGILGIVFAVAQHDYKRLLAYSSIENIGIITIGIGLAMLGRSLDRIELVVLGMGGALLHVLNHSLFKPMLFLGAGNILHATRTRQIDSLGGLGKSMPRTFGLVALGGLAICGLPPLNGFASEFLVYSGLFKAVGVGPAHAWCWAAIAAPALALIGALALATFVKLIGAVFAGTPRTSRIERAHDPSGLMLGPMVFLGACCALIGLVPWAVAGFLHRAIEAWSGASVPGIGGVVPLYWITATAAILLAFIVACALALRSLRRRQPSRSAGTWGCGYIAPTPRMQYTGSSFSQMLTGLSRWVLLPRKILTSARGLFPDHARFQTEISDTALDRGFVPAFSLAERILTLARPLQRGTVQLYLVYILTALLALLLFASW